ncbi:hypothetical protein J2Z48_000779 [Croceifilum oryzae]|uniref:Uncharacterized protein n=1 Tax=Croceifilum oryzae TaxID=1553429 RepID=A0AAJ1THG2_9BACL|nr:DUF5819 family protein [Croceifilum oryzae]MDQ0416612.1 hypothetical protein [Croceifilum oryzae]
MESSNHNKSLFYKGVYFGLPFALIGFILFHFSIIILHVMPINPISIALEPEVNAYTGALFRQNWHLFSPEPVTENDVVYMKVKTKSNQESDWIDITTPFISANNENYLSPLNRIMRIPSTAVNEMHGEEELINRYKKKIYELNKEKESEKILKRISEYQLKNSKDTRMLLYRFVFSTAARSFSPDDIQSVNVRVVTEEPVPYSQRKNPTYERKKTYEELGWENFTHVLTW